MIIDIVEIANESKYNNSYTKYLIHKDLIQLTIFFSLFLINGIINCLEIISEFA